jgi:hypothetical protein
MSAHLVERSSTKAPGLVAALVDSGIVAPEDRSRAIAILDHQLGRTAGEAPRSKILAEIAGYAGGILVVAAGAVFLAASWREMSLATRVGALLLGALVLAGAALGARLTGRDTPEDADVRRRLAGAFGIGSAALATGALGTYIEHQHHTGDGWIALVFGAFTVLALGFYVLAPTVPGQAAVGFGVAATVLNATSGWSDGRTLIKTVILLALGIGWLALAELRWWREPDTARVVGGALSLLGAETRYGPLAWRMLREIAMRLVVTPRPELRLAGSGRSARLSADMIAAQGRLDDRLVQADAPEHAVSHSAFDVCRGSRVAARRQGVLGVVEHAHVDADARQRVDEGGDRAIAAAEDGLLDAVDGMVASISSSPRRCRSPSSAPGSSGPTGRPRPRRGGTRRRTSPRSGRRRARRPRRRCASGRPG